MALLLQLLTIPTVLLSVAERGRAPVFVFNIKVCHEPFFLLCQVIGMSSSSCYEEYSGRHLVQQI